MRTLATLATRAAFLLLSGGAAIVVVAVLTVDDASAAAPVPPDPLGQLVERTIDDLDQTVDEAVDEAVSDPVDPAVAPIRERLDETPVPVPSPLPALLPVNRAPVPPHPMVAPSAGLPSPPTVPGAAANARTTDPPSPTATRARGADLSPTFRTRSAPDPVPATDATRRTAATASSHPAPETTERFPHQAAVLIPPVLIGAAGLGRRSGLHVRPPPLWWASLDARPG